MTVEELITELQDFPPNAKIELETKWGTTYPTKICYDNMINSQGKKEVRCTISDISN